MTGGGEVLREQFEVDPDSILRVDSSEGHNCRC